ncbi:MAG TPA: uracil-DNA glycosylase family protein [Puia sp.]|nr:uracil-DNA glycosylase family protein [Puia sp.]
MAVEYSLISSPIGEPHQIKQCRSCGLYTLQLPLICERRLSQIFWVGLSAVKLSQGEEGVPLSQNTPTGKLVYEIEKPFTKTLSFYRTNLVKCAPMLNGKIRYPTKQEMSWCFPNLEEEIAILNPKVIILLGKQVSNFVVDEGKVSLDENFSYRYYSKNNIHYIPVHHPSYVLVYKRKNIQTYISNIQTLISRLSSSGNRRKKVNLPVNLT